jgi:glutathione synthase/RimK-type ligase-like ATP-grasp enzyme
VKEVLVFYSFRKHKTDYYRLLLDPFMDSQEEYGLKFYQGSLKDLQIEVIGGNLKVTDSLTGRDIKTFDAVYFELWLKSSQQALAAAMYLKKAGIPFISQETLNTLCYTKIGELARMADSGIPLPQSFMSSKAETLKRFKENPPLKYPFIVKAADTFGGKLNFLVKNYSELKEALESDKEQYFVAQEFIPNDFDYRILVMGGEIKLVMKRSRDRSSASHVNNTSAGGDAEFMPISVLTEQMQQDALLAAKRTLRDDFSGVDLLVDKNTGQHYVLEVNEAPAIQMGANPEVKVPVMMEFLSQLAGFKGKN